MALWALLYQCLNEHPCTQGTKAEAPSIETRRSPSTNRRENQRPVQPQIHPRPDAAPLSCILLFFPVFVFLPRPLCPRAQGPCNTFVEATAEHGPGRPCSAAGTTPVAAPAHFCKTGRSWPRLPGAPRANQSLASAAFGGSRLLPTDNYISLRKYSGRSLDPPSGARV